MLSLARRRGGAPRRDARRRAGRTRQRLRPDARPARRPGGPGRRAARRRRPPGRPASRGRPAAAPGWSPARSTPASTPGRPRSSTGRAGCRGTLQYPYAASAARHLPPRPLPRRRSTASTHEYDAATVVVANSALLRQGHADRARRAPRGRAARRGRDRGRVRRALMRSLPKVYDGSHVALPEVTVLTGRARRAVAAAPACRCPSAVTASRSGSCPSLAAPPAVACRAAAGARRHRVTGHRDRSAEGPDQQLGVHGRGDHPARARR